MPPPPPPNPSLIPPPPAPPKTLRQQLAESRKTHIGMSEAWHWQQVTGQSPPDASAPVTVKPPLASSKLKRQLDLLTRDPRASDRLIQRLQANHPQRSQQWCYEKAIFDLERDRR